MRRTLVVWCASGPYHVPTHARVALFPIHLDPPTKQHRELFRLLLGLPDQETPSPLTAAPVSIQDALRGPSVSASPALADASTAAASVCTPASSVRGRDGSDKSSTWTAASRLRSFLCRGTPDTPGGKYNNGFTPTESALTAQGQTGGLSSIVGTSTALSVVPSILDDGAVLSGEGSVSSSDAYDTSSSCSSPFWYMEALAASLREDSQLAPFDDIILIPNTRGPVNLRHSTHLAALAVLAARGMPHVHVDFTALEHPDDSMPIIYELVCRYENSAVVHWLQDAYEMQNWANFSDFKNNVPILLLQTQSYPPRALEQHRPPGRPTWLTSRQYHAPNSHQVRCPREAAYYRDAAQFIQATATLRHRKSAGVALPVEAQEHREDLVDRADVSADYFADEQLHALNEACISKAATLDEEETSRIEAAMMHGSPPPSRHPKKHTTPHSTQLGLDYVDCAKGRWWNTPGGRGEDEVEVSRSYWNSASSGWLGGGFSVYPPLADWMMLGDGEGGAQTSTARALEDLTKAGRVIASTPAGGSGSDGVMSRDGMSVGGEREGARSRAASVTTAAAPMDTVVSDDGFALAAEDISPMKEVADRTSASAPLASLPDTDVAEELEDVRRELERMVHPTTPTSTTTTNTSPAGSENTTSASAAAAKREAFSAPQRFWQTFQQQQQHGHRPAAPTPRFRHRCIRQLLEELFPPRPFTASPSDTETVSGSGVSTNSGSRITASGTAAAHRAVAAGTIFHAAVHTSPTHVALLRGNVASIPTTKEGERSHYTKEVTVAGHFFFADAPPLVEVHPVTRSTGADVRQALWEQDIHPSSILTDCVQRYLEAHGLYRDPRKATAAALYAGLSANAMSSNRNGGGGVGGFGMGHGSSSTGDASGRDYVSNGRGRGGSFGMGLGGSASDISGGYGGDHTGGGGGFSAGGAVMDVRAGGRRVAQRENSTLSFRGLIPRLELHYDRNNLLAREQFEKLRIFQCQDGEEPDLIVPIGGDGYMMHCIRKNWRRFIPFYGVNAGHVGYLLNDRATLEELFSSPLKLHFTTMLYCQAEKEGETGERTLLSELAFNDAWVERSSGQTALIRILVNGQERIRRLRGDGVLVSTAAGSTAYSQALGASPVPVGAPLIQVVGSNVVSPAQWRPAHLDQEDQVEFEVIDSVKRPCRCYVDSVDVGNVTRLLVRSSRVAGVTLAFSKSCDLQQKLYQMQFPKTL